MAHWVTVGYEVIIGVRRTGVVGLLRNEALVKLGVCRFLSVRSFDEGARTITVYTRAPCDRTP